MVLRGSEGVVWPAKVDVVLRGSVGVVSLESGKNEGQSIHIKYMH